jgi:hypothetical protein
MFERQAVGVNEGDVGGKRDELTIPSPIDDKLCASLENSGRSNLFSFSPGPEAVRIGLCGTAVDALVILVELLRQTNRSKSSSSLQSLSVICLEHVFPASTRSGPKLSMLA